MKIKLENGAFKPSRFHSTDAGLDIRAMYGACVYAGHSEVIRTGVHVEIPHGCVGLLMSKSGLNIKHDITSTGVIDEGFTGEIMVKLYNHGFEDYVVHAGDKVTQLVIVPCRYEEPEFVDEIAGGDRGDAGFGSTGK